MKNISKSYNFYKEDDHYEKERFFILRSIDKFKLRKKRDN